MTSCHELCGAGAGDGKSAESGCRTHDISFVSVDFAAQASTFEVEPQEHMKESTSGE